MQHVHESAHSDDEGACIICHLVQALRLCLRISRGLFIKEMPALLLLLLLLLLLRNRAGPFSYKPFFRKGHHSKHLLLLHSWRFRNY